jgi:hypothetical protein
MRPAAARAGSSVVAVAHGWLLVPAGRAGAVLPLVLAVVIVTQACSCRLVPSVIGRGLLLFWFLASPKLLTCRHGNGRLLFVNVNCVI